MAGRYSFTEGKRAQKGALGLGGPKSGHMVGKGAAPARAVRDQCRRAKPRRTTFSLDRGPRTECTILEAHKASAKSVEPMSMMR